MNLIIDSQYILQQKIGSGSFSNVYLGKKILDNSDLALKLEMLNVKHPQLECEAKILRLLQGGAGIPKIHWFGKEGDFLILAMDLLGPNLSDLFNYCDKKFSLKTVLMLADQMLTSIEFLHENNFIHRDIKPENFVIGLGKKADQIYMLDYGLSKKYRDSRTGLHLEFQNNHSLGGAVRYISINSHLGIEQSRRDDLESLGYCLLYFLRGDLPWMNVDIKEKKKKYEKIMEIKVATPIEVLCEGFPEEFEIFLKYCKTLKFEERPDYVWLRRLFKNLFFKMNYKLNLVFDWAELSVKLGQKAFSSEEEKEINGLLDIDIKIEINNKLFESNLFFNYSILNDNEIVIENKNIKMKNDKNNIKQSEVKTETKLKLFINELHNIKIILFFFSNFNKKEDFVGKNEFFLFEVFNSSEKINYNLELLNDDGNKLNDQLYITLEWKLNK